MPVNELKTSRAMKPILVVFQGSDPSCQRRYLKGELVNLIYNVRCCY